jgi:hypothetical protein
VHNKRVTAAIARKGRPCRVNTENQFAMFTDI